MMADNSSEYFPGAQWWGLLSPQPVMSMAILSHPTAGDAMHASYFCDWGITIILLFILVSAKPLLLCVVCLTLSDPSHLFFLWLLDTEPKFLGFVVLSQMVRLWVIFQLSLTAIKCVINYYHT